MRWFSVDLRSSPQLRPCAFSGAASGFMISQDRAAVQQYLTTRLWHLRAARAARGAPAGGSTGVAGEHTVNSWRATRLLPPREPLAPARLVAAEADGGRARRASFAVAAPGRRHREIARTCDRWDLQAQPPASAPAPAPLAARQPPPPRCRTARRDTETHRYLPAPATSPGLSRT